MDIKDIWEADRLRTERVRAIPADETLDEALAVALGTVTVFWWAASNVRSVSLSAFEYFRKRNPDRVEAFAYRLLDEVAPWAEMDDHGVRMAQYHDGVVNDRPVSDLILSVLTAEPAAIVRAIILSLPES